TLKECEFIFVNDGSTDGSGSVIESYKRGDSRIKLIHQSNQGVSAARNRGLQMAKGEYVGFVDADDYVVSSMYEVMYKEAKEEDCDIVLSNMEQEMQGTKVIIEYPLPSGQTLDRFRIQQLVLPYLLKSAQCNAVVN